MLSLIVITVFSVSLILQAAILGLILGELELVGLEVFVEHVHHGLVLVGNIFFKLFAVFEVTNLSLRKLLTDVHELNFLLSE